VWGWRKSYRKEQARTCDDDRVGRYYGEHALDGRWIDKKNDAESEERRGDEGEGVNRQERETRIDNEEEKCSDGSACLDWHSRVKKRIVATFRMRMLLISIIFIHSINDLPNRTTDRTSYPSAPLSLSDKSALFCRNRTFLGIFNKHYLIKVHGTQLGSQIFNYVINLSICHCHLSHQPSSCPPPRLEPVDLSV
jgi:hypothetical protein